MLEVAALSKSGRQPKPEGWPQQGPPKRVAGELGPRGQRAAAQGRTDEQHQHDDGDNRDEQQQQLHAYCKQPLPAEGAQACPSSSRVLFFGCLYLGMRTLNFNNHPPNTGEHEYLFIDYKVSCLGDSFQRYAWSRFVTVFFNRDVGVG